MPDEDDHLLETIFITAKQLEDGSKRAAYLNKVCGDNLEIRRQVEKLLLAEQRADQFFEAKSIKPAREPENMVSEGPGTVIGLYKLLEKIGEGGMGVVYMAEQEHPIRRKVALKIIKLGMDTKQVVARFEAERQALALMDHPNIAKVLDAGATESGRPYFVMELVRGVPINRFCEERKLSFEARLKVFMDVCEAIRHAHQKGIIHRDLKPSNILVTLHGERAVPKVIDFGIAKATQQRLTEKTLFTGFSQMIGTPAYMSPEQAEMSNIEVDTRTDIYSLGVLLYELLTGTTPFPEEQLRSAGYVEMQRIIRDEEPEKPSTRLTKSRRARRDAPYPAKESLRPSDSAVSQGERSRTQWNASLPAIPPDLDWIVMMALAKDPDRRYESTIALADDLKRFLENEPVRAAAPSRLYTARKFIRRHRGLVMASASVAAALMIGLLLVMVAFIETGRERDRALAAEKETQEQVAIAEAVIDVFVEDILRAGDVWTASTSPVPNLTLREVLGRVADSIDGRFPDQPLVEATIRLLLSNTFGDPEDSFDLIDNLRRAHDLFLNKRGPRHPDTLKAKHALGWALSFHAHSQGEIAEGEALLQESLQGHLEILGTEHPDTLDVMGKLGMHYVNHGDYVTAERYLTEARALTEAHLPFDHRVSQNISYFLSHLRLGQERSAEARLMHEQRLTTYREQFGENDVRVANTSRDIGYYQWWWDRDFPAAHQTLTNALAVSREFVGNKYPTTVILEEIANVHFAQGDFVSALPTLWELLEANMATLGPDHQYIYRTVTEIISIYDRQGNWEGLIAESKKIRQLGISGPNLLAAELLTYRFLDDTNSMAELKIEFWQRFEEDPDSMSTSECALILSMLPYDPDEQPLLRDLTRRAEAKLRPNQWRQIPADFISGLNEYQNGNPARALERFNGIAFGMDHRRFSPIVKYMTAIVYYELGEDAQAEESLRSANDQLSNYLRLGDLDPPTPSYQPWISLAVCLLYRDQAERAIRGAIRSGPVTQESLAESRERWDEIRTLLARADMAGRSQNYQDAEQIYQEVWQHPEFNLEAVAMEDSAIGRKRLAVLANLGKWDDCFEFLSEFYGLMADSEMPDGLQLLSIPGSLPPALAERVRGSTDVKRTLVNETTGRPDYWAHLSQGLTRYREGDYEAAKELLRPAMEPAHYNHEMVAKLFTAMADYRLRNFDEAEERFREVEADFNQMLEYGDDLFYPIWYSPALIELNLKEARNLMADILADE